MVSDYNENMSGVDLFDQQKAAYPWKHRNRKWYMVLYHQLRDIAVHNARILYNMDHPNKKLGGLEFRQKLVEEILSDCTPKPAVRPGRWKTWKVTLSIVLHFFSSSYLLWLFPMFYFDNFHVSNLWYLCQHQKMAETLWIALVCICVCLFVNIVSWFLTVLMFGVLLQHCLCCHVLFWIILFTMSGMWLARLCSC